MKQDSTSKLIEENNRLRREIEQLRNQLGSLYATQEILDEYKKVKRENTRKIEEIEKEIIKRAGEEKE